MRGCELAVQQELNEAVQFQFVVLGFGGIGRPVVEVGRRVAVAQAAEAGIGFEPFRLFLAEHPVRPTVCNVLAALLEKVAEETPLHVQHLLIIHVVQSVK